ncbi:CvpA family protein [Leuconostoc carnosum]|uniref:CvpA family protein n=1 Tax=Leuconostoc TaxID=1243 RepID=UPI000D51DFB3|nr:MULTISPECIES: CvpA family protein [Leuconostoc]KAA8324781.1 CvpA family protein [Leuconostoc carnosum]KAA8358719.1 CvpA family protein [Leuconostoc carnosum]KAA8364889.1 CvpA family protein [Leuconostoc carnosum]KAA8366430.1 CvpA family protein [Leuconostoc carnosum]KAA8371813.1 CvpA family protein [Leuconostoc carnosum]
MILLIIAVIFVLASLLSGYRHGFVNGLLRLALLVVVWYIAIKFAEPLGAVFSNFVSGQFVRTDVPQDVANQGSKFLASGLTFTVLLIIGGAVSHYILRSLSIIRRIPLLGWVDGVLGAILYGLISATITFFALQLLSVIPNVWLQDQFLNTPLLNEILDNAPFFAQQIYQWWL